jgi:hypothetical protein
MARGAPTPRLPQPDPPEISRATLEFCDWLIDQVTLSAQHPDFDQEARRIATAKREIAEALAAAGGMPIGEQRRQQQAV